MLISSYIRLDKGPLNRQKFNIKIH